MAAFLRSRSLVACAATAATLAGGVSMYGADQRRNVALTEGKKIKLIYFNIPGLAFSLRAAMNHAKIDFEDVRVDEASFGKMKQEGKLPLNQLPVLVFPDGQMNCQSGPILRWAGKHSDLYPTKDAEKALLCDELMESASELRGKIPHSTDEVEKKRLREEFVGKDFAKYMKYFTRRIEASHGPFLLGQQLTLPDLILARFVNAIHTGAFDYIAPSIVKQEYALVWKHFEEVQRHPVYAAQAKREEEAEALKKKEK